jgi:ribonuclease P protein component
LRIDTLKKRGEFLATAARGRKFIASTLILQMLPRGDENTQDAPRFGFTVTKKMGNAVARNRIKRRLRAALRQIAGAHALAGHDYVIISRNKALDCPFAELVRDMEFAFSRIPTMKNNAKPKP